MMSTSNSIILPDIEVTPEEEEAWQAFSNNLTQNSSQSNVVETTLLAESTKQQWKLLPYIRYFPALYIDIPIKTTVKIPWSIQRAALQLIKAIEMLAVLFMLNLLRSYS